MRVSVIGCGYLGAVHAACMAELGHQVIGVDVDAEKISLLADGRAPFHEPDLPELLKRHTQSGALVFTSDFAEVVDCDLHFICVGTPQVARGNNADLSYLDAAISSLTPYVHGGENPSIVVGKSTVPVGTAERLADQLAKVGALVVWNPEFLREGFAVQDTLTPDRLVYGVPDDVERAHYLSARLDSCYQSLIEADIARIITDYATAELVKAAANAFLATKISFINAMAEVCEAAGANVTELAEAIGYDDRIGHKFLRAGVGFGGGCLPKDIRAFQARAEELGVGQALNFLREVDQINNRRRVRILEIAEAELGQLSGKTLAILGAAFKPNSDDMRNSPALDIARRLVGAGARVQIYDPAAGPVLRQREPGGMGSMVVDSLTQALDGADGALLLTEWREFQEMDPHATRELIANPVMVDGRNVLSPRAWRAAGWTYYSLGRP